MLLVQTLRGDVPALRNNRGDTHFRGAKMIEGASDQRPAQTRAAPARVDGN
jgi:hypothetical protein